MRIRAGLALGLLLALGVASCGGADGGDGVATAGGRASTSASAKPGTGDEREQLLKHAKCMRENGVPNFPDPKFDDNGGVSISLPEGVDKTKLEAAEKKCKQYLPNGGEPGKADPEVVEKLRNYSKCMRENGVPNFPDPTDQGLQIDGNKLGMEPNDPRFKAAEEKCKQHMPAPPKGESPGLQNGGGE